MIQVTINIDTDKMAGTVEEAFKHMKPEQYQEIAAQVIRDWMLNGIDCDLQEREKKAIALTKESAINLSDKKNYTDEDWKKEWGFQNKLKSLESLHTQLVSEIKTQALSAFKDKIKKYLDTEEMNEAFETCLEVIKKNFPSYVQEAMTSWFANQLSLNAYQLSDQTQRNQMVIDAMEEDLKSKGLLGY